MSFGRTGKILFINLTTKKFYCEKTEKYLPFIGGRGINQWLLFKSINKDIKPLDSESVIVLGSGPLVGTLVPSANRLAVDFKNVMNNGIGSANSGGFFAVEMKLAGYDHILISGKSKNKIYLLINDEKIYFKDANQVWGKNTWETENIIRRIENDNNLKVITIGIGGENLVKFACLVNDKGRVAGYGGGGAIFGSKNLKAIAIKGTKSIDVFSPNKLMKKALKYNENVVNKSPRISTYRKGGTVFAYLINGDKTPHGVKNMSEDYWSNDKLELFSRSKIDNFLIRRHSCFNCPACCSSVFSLDGIRFESFEANSLRSFATNLDVTNLRGTLSCHLLANLYGLEGDQLSATIAWAIECYENGILTKKETEGLELRWGNHKEIVQLINMIANRYGFGNILAEGVYLASKIVGRGSEKYSVMVKKVSLMEAAMRSHKGWALGIITSAKGAGHLRGAPSQERQQISSEMSQKLFNISSIATPTEYTNKAELVFWQEKYKAILDIMGICLLPTMWNDINLFQPEDILDFYYLATGNKLTIDDMFKTGEKIGNIEKIFNILHAGMTREDDIPPQKLIKIPVKNGMYKGEFLDLEEWNKMLNEYYFLHGWDQKTGIPLKEKLVELELFDKLEYNLQKKFQNKGILND